MQTILRCVALFLPILVASCAPAPAENAPRAAPHPLGALEEEVKSDYSLIRIRRHGNIRTMFFVRDSKEEVVETAVNLKKPHDLVAPYTRHMFAGYLFQPKQDRVLIVGLGGGAMVHFLRHYAPETDVTAVEIDPAVVKLADRYFDVRPGKNLKIVTGDGVQFLEKTDDRYDAVYMDAFLKPSAGTDATGAPLAMKTVQFYKRVQQKLKPGGVVVFNLNQYQWLESDIKTLREAFAQIYVFRLGDGNVVVVGSPNAVRETPAALKARAREIDRRFKATFSFAEMLNRLAR